MLVFSISNLLISQKIKHVLFNKPIEHFQLIIRGWIVATLFMLLQIKRNDLGEPNSFSENVVLLDVKNSE
jgi:hypothetical protein